MISPVKNNIIIPINTGKIKNSNIIEPVSSTASSSSENSLSGKKLHFVSYHKRSQQFFEPLIRFVDKLVSQEIEINKKLSEREAEKENENIEKAAEKIVDFAKKLSGEDKSQAGQIKNAVRQGIKQANESLENFTETSQKILNSVFKKIDSWYYDKQGSLL